MAADGGCEGNVVHRMNEGYRAWGALKSVLSSRGFGDNGQEASIWSKSVEDGYEGDRG